MRKTEESAVSQIASNHDVFDVRLGEVMAVSGVAGIQLGMASNPNCPTDVLDSFLDLEIGAVTKAVAANPAITLPTLLSLFELSLNIISTQPKEEPETEGPLAGLYVGNDTEVRHARRVLEAVAWNSMLPLSYLERLWLSHDVDVQELAGRNPNLPTEILEEYASSEHFRLRRAVAGHASISTDMLKRLANDEDEGVRRGVAGNPRTPASILHRLVKDESMIVQHALRNNPNLTPALREKLHVSVPELPSAVSPIRPKITESLPTTAAEFNDFVAQPEFTENLWLYLASSLTTPFDHVIGRLDDVRSLPTYPKGVSPSHFAALNEHTPESQLEILAGFNNKKVRKAVGRKLAAASANLEVLKQLVRDREASVRKAVAEAAGPIFPEQLWNELANDEKSSVRKAVLGNEHASDLIRAAARLNELTENYED